MRTKYGKASQDFIVPDIAKLLKGSKGESLIYFGKTEQEDRYTLCLGVGRVVSIKTGETFDWVKINFGRHYSKDIVVKHNHARRQIYTLKKGQLAWFYGYATTIHKKDGSLQTLLYAKGLQGWYVPKMFDIKKIDSDDLPSAIEEQEQKEMQDAINDIFDMNKEKK